jgi:hypothetical protein
MKKRYVLYYYTVNLIDYLKGLLIKLINQKLLYFKFLPENRRYVVKQKI